MGTGYISVNGQMGIMQLLTMLLLACDLAQAFDNDNHILVAAKGAEWGPGGSECKTNFEEKIFRKWEAVNQFECKVTDKDGKKMAECGYNFGKCTESVLQECGGVEEKCEVKTSYGMIKKTIFKVGSQDLCCDGLTCKERHENGRFVDAKCYNNASKEHQDEMFNSKEWTQTENIWNDAACENLGNYQGNLTQCKIQCIETTGCTAINFHYHETDPGCTLRECSEDQKKKPNFSWPGFVGYYWSGTTWKIPSSDLDTASQIATELDYN